MLVHFSIILYPDIVQQKEIRQREDQVFLINANLSLRKDKKKRKTVKKFIILIKYIGFFFYN